MCRLAYIPMLLSIFAVIGIGVGSAAALLLLAIIVVLIIIAIIAVLKPKTKGEVINSDFSIPYVLDNNIFIIGYFNSQQ